jgi:hypothetical protein
MNTFARFPTQTNCREGLLNLAAGQDLTGKSAYLGVLGNNAGKPKITLPATFADFALFLILDENVSGSPVTVEALDPVRDVRIVLKGTCNPGDILILADPATPADAGKVRTIPATAGRYFRAGIAQEIGVDGQLVLLRPLPGLINYLNANTLTGLTFTGGGATGAEVAALRDAVKVILETQGLMA